MYEPYADKEYYLKIYQGKIPEDDVDKALKNASRHIDILTYNRIKRATLSPYQKEIIEEVCCEMADFEYENEDMLKSVLKSYSINGTSMTFGESWNIYVHNGVAVNMDSYAKLKSTGFTGAVLR